MSVTGKITGWKSGEAEIFAALPFQESVILLQVNSAVYIKWLAQAREGGFEAEDAIVCPVAAAQDQPSLPNSTGPLNRIPDHRIGRPYELESGICSAEKRKDVTIVVQVKCGRNDLVAILRKNK